MGGTRGHGEAGGEREKTNGEEDWRKYPVESEESSFRVRPCASREELVFERIASTVEYDLRVARYWGFGIG